MTTKHQKTCAVCGKSFPCPPSSKTVTCSKECSRIHRSRVHKGVSNEWDEESRERLRSRGQTQNLQMGTPAAKLSPNSGPFETNCNARHWILCSPDGIRYEFDNLNLFVREHPEWFPNAVSARTALSAIARGKTRAIHYKGWSVEYRSALIRRDRELVNEAVKMTVFAEKGDKQ